jgi:hypothetical protein
MLPDVADPQIALPLPGAGTRPQGAKFTIDQVRAIPSVQGSIEMSMRCSGLLSKDFQLGLGMNGGHWSRVENGGAPFPFQELDRFMDIAGNEIPLIWSAERRGWNWESMRKHHSDAEARIAMLEKENADLTRSLALVVNARR